LESEPEEAAVSGAAVGATAGGSIGALGAWVSSSIPGFESMFVAGALTTTIGAVVGGYLGSLYNVRADSKTEIDIDEELAAGKVLLIVKTDEGEMETAVSILSQNNGQHVETHTISDSDQ
jgi:outer membrane lipoprotein SlyB